MEIVRNRLDVKEKNSGKVYTFFYRTPEFEEWFDYSAKIRSALKIKDEEEQVKAVATVKLDGTEMILTGIGENQFEFEIEGKEIFLTADHPDWKSVLRRYFYYLLFQVFDDAFSRRGEIQVEKK